MQAGDQDSKQDSKNDQAQQQQRRELLRAPDRRLNDPNNNGAQMAGQVFLSRYHFQRVFRRAVGETPGGLRRRLLNVALLPQ